MVFTISPTEAQAIQEDEAQLIYAISQVARGIAISLNQPPPQTPEQPDTLRIQMGRRLVYGQMAKGPFRNELNADAIKAIFDAIQHPVTPDIDPEQYQGKLPAIEIRNGEDILFREERDDVITVNKIQLQLDQNAAAESKQAGVSAPASTQGNGKAHLSVVEPTAVSTSANAPEIEDADWKAEDIAQMADYLLNPLGEDKPIYDAVSIQGYQITQENDGVTVTKDNHPIVATQAEEVTVNNITQADWAVFQRIQQQAFPPKFITDSIHLNGKDLNGKVGVEIDGEELLDQSSAETETAEAISLRATPPALSVLERETAKLPEGPTKSLLQTTTQDWKQQLQQGLQKGLKQGMNWLAFRPEAIRTQAAARATLDLFNRGYERTGEKAYSVEGFQLTLRGLNLYTLSDAKGTLLRFQAFKSSLPGVNQPNIQVLSRSNRLKPNLVKGLKELQHNSQITPRGDLDQEANYVLKTNRLESVVRDFLQTRAKAKVWDREGGQYRLEIGDRDFLRITDKQGERGVVFQRQNGEVFSRLGAADFAHFDRLADRMEQVNQQPTKSIQVQPGVKQKGVGLAME